MLRTCSEVKGIMREIGLQNVEVMHFPADGKTAHGGWIMPKAWNPRSGKLEIVFPDGTREELCSYEKVPCSLMLYSTGCDITGKMVMFSPDADVKGKFVLGGNHFYSMKDSLHLFRGGAAVLLSDKLTGAYQGRKGYEYLDDACQWCNYSLPFWRETSPRCGFSLTPNQSAYLRDLWEKNGEVTLHASVDAELTDGTIPLVRETGGLKDTVTPYNQYDNSGNGFSFRYFKSDEMIYILVYAITVYYEKKMEWNKLVQNAMTTDVSWLKSAGKYKELYKSIL